MNIWQWWLESWLTYLAAVLPPPQVKPENKRPYLVWSVKVRKDGTK